MTTPERPPYRSITHDVDPFELCRDRVHESAMWSPAGPPVGPMTEAEFSAYLDQLDAEAGADR